MTSFDDIFGKNGSGKQQSVTPSIEISGCEFRVIGVEPNRVWRDGQPTDELKTDELGERVQCTVSFILTDAKGWQLSTATPLRDKSQWLTVEEAAKVKEWADAPGGSVVELLNPRIELRTSAKTKHDSNFAKNELVLTFAFDGFKF